MHSENKHGDAKYCAALIEGSDVVNIRNNSN